MATKELFVTHTFAGGWATDFGPQFYGAPDQAGALQLPFLVEAPNCVYELDGAPHKCPGVTRVNTAVINDGTTGILGCYDYWRQGTAGTPTQRRVVYASDGKIYADAANGTFASIKTGLVTTAVPNFSTFNDLLIISNDSTDVPMSWDQTTFQNLAGTPPRFSFSVKHRGRQWAAGVFANPSRLYYSVLASPEDWAGAGSGSILIDSGDGDHITGIQSYKNELWVFKGPNKGSIHRITGSSDSGTDAFARTTFVQGITAAWQNCIFLFGDDLGFLSPWGTLHSIKATAAFGNYFQSFLSFPIGTYLKENVNRSRLRYASAVDDPTSGRVMITFPVIGGTVNTRVIMMDYRFGVEPPNLYPRFSLWDAFSWASLCQSTDASNSNTPTVLAGGYNGRLYRTGQSTRSNDGQAIRYGIKTPFLTYGNELYMKTISTASIGILPRSGNDMLFGWTRDGNNQQTQTKAQGGGDTLA